MRKTLLSIIAGAGIAAAGLIPFDTAHIEVSFDHGNNLSDLTGGWLYRGSHGSPEFADWDGDGRKDLLLGYMGNNLGSVGGGYMNVFLNSGTETEPHFTEGFKAPISVNGG